MPHEHRDQGGAHVLRLRDPEPGGIPRNCFMQLCGHSCLDAGPRLVHESRDGTPGTGDPRAWTPIVGVHPRKSDSCCKPSGGSVTVTGTPSSCTAAHPAEAAISPLVAVEVGTAREVQLSPTPPMVVLDGGLSLDEARLEREVLAAWSHLTEQCEVAVGFMHHLHPERDDWMEMLASFREAARQTSSPSLSRLG